MTATNVYATGCPPRRINWANNNSTKVIVKNKYPEKFISAYVCIVMLSPVRKVFSKGTNNIVDPNSNPNRPNTKW